MKTKTSRFFFVIKMILIFTLIPYLIGFIVNTFVIPAPYVLDGPIITWMIGWLVVGLVLGISLVISTTYSFIMTGKFE